MRFLHLSLLAVLAAALGGCGGTFPDGAMRNSADSAMRNSAGQTTPGQGAPGKSPARPAGPAPSERFAALDADHDGFLERGETEGHWSDIFLLLNARGDGRLRAAEFMALPSPKRTLYPSLMQMNDPARWRSFAALDPEGKGYIALADWLAAADRLFDMLDRNGDGKLSPDELGIVLQAPSPDNPDSREPPAPPRLLPASEVPPAPPPLPALPAGGMPEAGMPPSPVPPAAPTPVAAPPAPAAPVPSPGLPAVPPPATTAPPPRPHLPPPTVVPPMAGPGKGDL